MSELHMMLLASLMDIQRFGPKDKTMGICTNVIRLMGDRAELGDAVGDVLDELFKTWPEISNSLAYPVGNWSSCPSKLFWYYYDKTKSMWADDRYGTARWNLLNHCIKTLELN